MRTQPRSIRHLAIAALLPILAAAAGWYAIPPGSTVEAARAGAAIHTRATYGATRHGGIALETLRNAAEQLQSASVQNSHGDMVGSVRDVVVGRHGQPKLVEVEFGGFLGVGGDVVPLAAKTLGYDSRHNVVLTDMTVKQLAVIAERRATDAD